MPDMSDNVLRLPVGRGSLEYIAFRMSYAKHGVWVCHSCHRHTGEKHLCESRDRYDELTLDELVDTVSSTVAAANYRRIYLPSGGCAVQP